jgi:hypothetical protein
MLNDGGIRYKLSSFSFTCDKYSSNNNNIFIYSLRGSGKGMMKCLKMKWKEGEYRMRGKGTCEVN